MSEQEANADGVFSEDSGHIDTAAFLIAFFFLISSNLVVEYIVKSKKINKYVPEAAITVAFSALVSLVFFSISHFSNYSWENAVGSIEFNPSIFYFILLPPIIFNSGCKF